MIAIQPDYTKPAFDAMHRGINELILPIAIYGCLAVLAYHIFEHWLFKKLKERKLSRSKRRRRR